MADLRGGRAGGRAGGRDARLLRRRGRARARGRGRAAPQLRGAGKGGPGAAAGRAGGGGPRTHGPRPQRGDPTGKGGLAPGVGIPSCCPARPFSAPPPFSLDPRGAVDAPTPPTSPTRFRGARNRPNKRSQVPAPGRGGRGGGGEGRGPHKGAFKGSRGSGFRPPSGPAGAPRPGHAATACRRRAPSRRAGGAAATENGWRAASRPRAPRVPGPQPPAPPARPARRAPPPVNSFGGIPGRPRPCSAGRGRGCGDGGRALALKELPVSGIGRDTTGAWGAGGVREAFPIQDFSSGKRQPCRDVGLSRFTDQVLSSLT